MIGVIYARYSSDSQREESIDGSFVNATLLPKSKEFQFSIPISTEHYQQRQIIDRRSNR